MSSRNLVAAALALSLGGGILTACGSPKSEPAKADPLAVSDPNAKARALLDELAAIPESDRESWVSQNSFAFAVFETATDPELKARYQKEIAPLRGGQ